MFTWLLFSCCNEINQRTIYLNTIAIVIFFLIAVLVYMYATYVWHLMLCIYYYSRLLHVRRAVFVCSCDRDKICLIFWLGLWCECCYMSVNFISNKQTHDIDILMQIVRKSVEIVTKWVVLAFVTHAFHNSSNLTSLASLI